MLVTPPRRASKQRLATSHQGYLLAVILEDCVRALDAFGPYVFTKWEKCISKLAQRFTDACPERTLLHSKVASGAKHFRSCVDRSSQLVD